ncbi:SsrA-binding protein [Wenyingzhuangia sp. chi5]|uniref:SsrA-binding protein n=1 Tax=Wenyingzhuangia gilva TaxID=3057677 RepID=A0ABT8VSK9_9FLAO|nr:SsrA-binding protein [Wenyingzhuangia sp. chi5]MDO3694972.1 SsrA-binding protein [Wenyingzhuangia sp. chi5]
MKKRIFRSLAKCNKVLLPSYGRKQLDISRASKTQLLLIGWRAFVTKNSL